MSLLYHSIFSEHATKSHLTKPRINSRHYARFNWLGKQLTSLGTLLVPCLAVRSHAIEFQPSMGKYQMIVGRAPYSTTMHLVWLLSFASFSLPSLIHSTDAQQITRLVRDQTAFIIRIRNFAGKRNSFGVLIVELRHCTKPSMFQRIKKVEPCGNQIMSTRHTSYPG